MTKTIVDAEVYDIETVADALKTSPHGVCVYEAGNDVVDHQTVTLEYEGGVTASIVMSACKYSAPRDEIYLTMFSLRGRVPKVDSDRRNQGGVDWQHGLICEFVAPPRLISRPFLTFSLVKRRSIDRYRWTTLMEGVMLACHTHSSPLSRGAIKRS